MNRDEAQCPICGDLNACEVALGQETCWCFSATVHPEVGALLAERGIDDQCLCSPCASGDVPSPCIGICVVDEAGESCVGCHRTLKEIEHWGTLGPVARAEISLRLRQSDPGLPRPQHG